MDKKELFQQLMQMKKEYDKKRKKLQLAKRVKNAREHVQRKIQEQNELMTRDEGSFQDKSDRENVSSPIVLSFKEKSLALNFSDLMLQNSDSSKKEKLPNQNCKPGPINKDASEDSSRDSPSKEKTCFDESNDYKDEDVKKCNIASSEKQINCSRNLEKLPESEIKDNSNSSGNVDNLNSENSADILKISALSIKQNNSSFGSSSSVPPTIRRKRKYSASFRDIPPPTTESTSTEFHCDINQSSLKEKPKQKRRSFKKEEQNVILLSVLDYIVEEGKRDAIFKEFQLPDSEYAHIKSKQIKKNKSCRKVESSSSGQSATKMVGVDKVISIKDNPINRLTECSNITNSANLEESEHFRKHFSNPSEDLQNSLPEDASNADSCKLVSQNLLESVCMSKNIQEGPLQSESADTPRKTPKQNVNSKAEISSVDSEDTPLLENSKSFLRCLPLTRTDTVKNSQQVAHKHEPNTNFKNHFQESQERSDSLDHVDSEDPRNCQSKMFDKTNHQIPITDLKSKICLTDHQDILDSVDADELLSDRGLPLLPRCSQGLSQVNITNPTKDSVSDDKTLTKRWQNKESPTDLFSKTENQDSFHEELDSKTRIISSKSNNTNTGSTMNIENASANRSISSETQSERDRINIENNNTKSTTKMTLCDNKNKTALKTDKQDPETGYKSVIHHSGHRSDHLLHSNEDISKCVDSQSERMSAPSLIVKSCVHTFSSFVCDSELNNKAFQNLKAADSFKLPDSNEEVVSLLNSRLCPSSRDDLSSTSKDLLICVTQYRIYLWAVTQLGTWEIVHQQQITETGRCCQASLHPLQNGIGVATVLVTLEGESQLVLHAFQMQEDIESKQLPVTLQQIHKLVYICLNSYTMAVARTSNDRTIEISKYVLSENLSSIESIHMLEFSSDRLLSLNTVKGLPAALLGFTATYILFVWNHVANVLLTKISLSDILVKPCMLPSAFTEQGHIVFPILFDDGPEHGCLLAINPNTDVVVKLLSYQRHLLPDKKSDSRMALVLHDNLLSVQDNVLGVWDLYSGSLMACVNSFGMTCMTLFCSDKEIFLITGHKQSCVHIYRLHTLQHPSQST